MDRDQEQQLRSRRFTDATSEVGKWKALYKVLFPQVDECAIPSPYVESTFAINEISKTATGPSNPRPLSTSIIHVDFEKSANDQQNHDISRDRSNTQTSLHPSSAERRGHTGSRDVRNEEPSRFALTLQTDVDRHTSDWVYTTSPVFFSSETPLSGSGYLQSHQYSGVTCILPSDSGISVADSRSPNDEMSETSEDLEIHRLQLETDELRREVSTFQTLLLHHRNIWAEEKSSLEKKVHELEDTINSLRNENKTLPMELCSPVRGDIPKPEHQMNPPNDVDEQTEQRNFETTAPEVNYGVGLSQARAQEQNDGLQFNQSPAQLRVSEQEEGVIRSRACEPMQSFLSDEEDSSESESELELAAEEKWVAQISRHHRKLAFQKLLQIQMAALDSSASQQSTSTPPSSGSSGGGKGAKDSSGSSWSGNSKRGREGGDNWSNSDGKDDKDGNRDNNTRESKRQKSDSRPRFACIFYQQCPEEHQRGACTGPGFTTIGRLR
jgi:hypothetical protein